MVEGYCTADDVRVALQEAELDSDGGGPLSTSIVEAAIDGQTDWLRRKTQRHWYTTDSSADDILPTSPRTIDEDNYDIPSSPHAGHTQLPSADERRYPLTQNGGYAEIKLNQHDVQSITKLLVRETGSEYTDWVADADREQGRGKDYYLESNPRTNTAYLYLYARGFTPAQDWRNAVIVSFDYGADEIPGTVRRAVAFKTASELLLDDDAALGIPENASFVSAESKVKAMERKAEELLEDYR